MGDRKYGACLECGKPQAPHYAKGLCARCYQRRWREANAHEWRAIHLRSRAKQAGVAGDATGVQISARIQYYGEKCYLCGAPYEGVDHVIPLSRGGPNWPSNIRPVCISCNTVKGHNLLGEKRRKRGKLLKRRNDQIKALERRGKTEDAHLLSIVQETWGPFTDTELASILGISRNHIYAIFRGQRRPSRKFLAGVLVAFPELMPSVVIYLARNP